MSSILKALKKIEGRKVETRLPAWHYRFGRESMDTQVRRSKQRQKILGTLIALCLVALAVKLFPLWRNAPESGAPEQTRIAIAPPTDKPGTSTAALSYPATAAPTTGTDSTTLSSPLAAPVQSPDTVEALPEASAETPPASVKAETAQANSTEISPAPAPGTNSPAIYPETSSQETFDPAPANKAGLSLQALVWSESPDERFAVINGQFLTEGSTVEDSTIVQIEESDVVVRTGGSTWKLK